MRVNLDKGYSFCTKNEEGYKGCSIDLDVDVDRTTIHVNYKTEGDDCFSLSIDHSDIDVLIEALILCKKAGDNM